MVDDNTRLVIVLEAQAKKLQNSLVQVNKNIDRFAAQTERRFDQMNKKNAASFANLTKSMNGSLGGLRTALAPVAAALSVREIVSYADAWTTAGNKIAAASQVSGIQARSLDALKDGANEARSSLEQYVDLYSRLLRTSEMVGASELEVARATEVVSKSFLAGGASTQEQIAGLIQLGQAISSGFLQGDELRSIRENAPLLAKAIADEFGVTIGELKELGAQGKLTSKEVFDAIINGGKEIDAAFAVTKSTIRQAFSRIENEFIAYIGNAGDASGATRGLIDALNYLAENFKEVADVVLQFATVLAGALAGRALGAVVVTSGQAVLALGALLSAMRAGTLAAVTFSAAMGPISILAGAAAGALYLLWSEHQNAMRAAELHSATLEENRKALDLADGAGQGYIDNLRRQINAQITATEAALAEAEAQYELAAARRAASGVVFGMGSEFTPSINDGSGSEVEDAEYRSRKASERLSALREQLEELDSKKPGGGDGDSPPGRGSGGGRSSPDDYEKAMESVRERTNALEAEAQALVRLNPLVEDYGYAVNKAKAEYDLLSAAQKAGLTITPELRDQMSSLAEVYAMASVEVRKLTEANDLARESAEDFRDTSKDVLRGFVDDIVAGTSAIESLGNAMNKIGDKFLDLGFDVLFGGGASGGFGAIGKIFGLAEGGVVARGKPLKTFARGGVSNTAAVFGEAGPEAAVPLPDGRRIPVDLRVPQTQGGSMPSITYAPTIDASGADAAAISRLEQVMARDRVEFTSKVVGVMRDVKRGRYKP